MMDKKSEELSNTLSREVYRRYEAAKSAKSDTYQDMRDCFRMSRGKPLTDPVDSVDIVMDVASPVVQNIIGLMRHILLNNEQAPFVIKSTPRAELSDNEMAQVENKIFNEGHELLAMIQDQAHLESVFSEMKRSILLEANKQARKAAERQTELVQDQLHDAGWKTAFIGFLKHFCIYPAAIMKGPVLKSKMETFWQGDTVQTRRTVGLSVELISPFDFYPAPYSRTVESADYIIERRRMTRGDLTELYDIEDYDGDAIDEIFDAYPDGYRLSYEMGDGESDHPDSESGVAVHERDVFDAIGYYGTLRGRVLADAGLDVADERVNYEVEVWIIGGVVIKAVLNPDVQDNRPFCVASFDATTDSIWGISPMMRLRDTQKSATATMRALVRNMRYSSAPMGEVVANRIKDGNNPAEIIPGTIRMVEDAKIPGQSPTAYTFYEIPSLSGELSALFDRFVAYSYELLGIPRVAFGQSDAVGTVGRTAGGVSIVMNQATKAIKNAMTELEEGLIEPMVNKFIRHNQLNMDDPDLRGDVRAFAKGVSGIIEKESKTEDLLWLFQSMAPMAGQTTPDGQTIIPHEAPARILYEICKLKGINTTGVFPDYDARDALVEDFGTATGQQAPSPLNEPATLPVLDGRSEAAAQAIDTANTLG